MSFNSRTAFENHKHPEEEVIYVLEIEFEYIVEVKILVILKVVKFIYSYWNNPF